MNKLVLILVLMTLSSCTPVTKYVPVILDMPPPIPQEMRLTQEELVCVSDSTLSKIVLLDNRRRTLEQIILSTH